MRSAILTPGAVFVAAGVPADRGLNGFTVEELCEQVGISRRTFFNYFPTKEDAILGHSDGHRPDDLVDAFMASAGSVPLLEALVDFAAAAGGRLEMTRDEFAQLHAVMQREPRLLVKLFGDSAVKQKEFAALIARRESMAPDDPRAIMAAQLIGQLAWQSTHAFFSGEEGPSFRQILDSQIDAARYLFADGTHHTASEGTP